MLRNYMYNGLQLQFEEKFAPEGAVLIEEQAPKEKAKEPKNKARKPSTKEPGNGDKD